MTDATTAENEAGAGSDAVLRSSRAMAGGTVASRLTGMLREPVVGAALGTGLLGDAYGLANVVPNIIYILLVGGVLNAVFVPQLVRHIATDHDGGDGYADRLITAVGLILLGVTVAAVLAAPAIVRLYAQDASAAELNVATIFARFCLVQIFFYGVFTMYQQVLNSRGSFVAPMYAPILNNVVVIGVFIWFIAVNGTHETVDTITLGQMRLLGIGTTAGVVAQALVLVPAAARIGYRLRPRKDLRGHGLGHAWLLARWTIAFVLVNQLTYVLVARLATSANTGAPAPAWGSASTSRPTCSSSSRTRSSRSRSSPRSCPGCRWRPTRAGWARSPGTSPRGSGPRARWSSRPQRRTSPWARTSPPRCTGGATPAPTRRT